jgi:hypothetical protein
MGHHGSSALSAEIYRTDPYIMDSVYDGHTEGTIFRV